MPTEQDTVGKKKKKYSYKVHLIPKNCKGCGICAEVCPAHAITLVNEGES